MVLGGWIAVGARREGKKRRNNKKARVVVSQRVKEISVGEEMLGGLWVVRLGG